MIEPHPFKNLDRDPLLDTSSFSLGDLVKVTRLPIGTVRMWLERKILELGPYDKDASGKGTVRQFTLRTVYFAATMAEITRLGITPSQAARWAHVIWRFGVETEVVPSNDMVFIGSPTSERFRIARRNGLSTEVIFDDSSPAESPELTAVVLDVSGVVRKCRTALGLME
jgi:hypothetical protein